MAQAERSSAGVGLVFGLVDRENAKDNSLLESR